MALPTYVGSGGTQSSTSGITQTAWPTGHQADDIGILIIETSAQAPGINPPSGWTALTSQSTGTAGAAGATALYVFWRRAVSNAEAKPDIGDSGDHQISCIFAFRGCENAASPIDVFSGAVQASSSTSVSIPTATTLSANCLVVNLVSNAFDNTTVGQGSGWANASLVNLTERKQCQSGVGFGGGFAIVTGEKAVAGATGATTGTLANASAQALITFALKPPSGTSPFGGIYVATGIKQTAGAYAASTGTLANSLVQGALSIALKPPTPVSNNPPTLTAIPDLFVNVGDVLLYPTAASDPDGDPLTYSINPGTTVVPGTLAIDASGVIQWTPLTVDHGSWNVTVRVTDSHSAFVEQAVNITVTGGFANAVEVATRAKADADAAKALADLLDLQEQMNANVIRKARDLAAELQASSDYMQTIITAQS